MKSETIGALAAALAKAQSEIRSARKDAENPFFKSRYADLSSVWDACRAPLTANQLAVVQTTEPTDGNTVAITTTLIHASGEWIAGTLAAKPVKNDPQSLGSCITYLRRYALSALVGVAASDGTDDDGNLASHAVSEPHSEPPSKHEPPAKTAHQRLNDLVPTLEEQYELRNYLRDVPGKSGQFGLRHDQELFDVSPELANYMVQNWPKVKKAVFEHQNSIPGAELPPEPAVSSWRNAVLPFPPKDHPELKGKTIGEAMDNPATKNWAFGMLMNFEAKPYNGKISPEAVALQEAGLNWRRENGKLKEGEV